MPPLDIMPSLQHRRHQNPQADRRLLLWTYLCCHLVQHDAMTIITATCYVTFSLSILVVILVAEVVQLRCNRSASCWRSVVDDAYRAKAQLESSRVSCSTCSEVLCYLPQIGASQRLTRKKCGSELDPCSQSVLSSLKLLICNHHSARFIGVSSARYGSNLTVVVRRGPLTLAWASV